MTWTERIYAFLDEHPDDRPRVDHTLATGRSCTAKRHRRLARWEQKARGTDAAHRVEPCNAVANWRLDGEYRCPPHVLQGLEGRDP